MEYTELRKKGVYLGRAGEDGKRTVWLDVTTWNEQAGGGSGVLLYTSPKGQVWPLGTQTETDETTGTVKLLAPITLAETAAAGIGHIEAQWMSGGEKVKSMTFNTLVLASAYTGETVPDKAPHWVQELIEELNAAGTLLEELGEVASEAHAAYEEIRGTSVLIDQALNTAEATVAQAQEYAEAAEGHAGNANDYKTAAAASATAAAASAEQAMDATPAGYAAFVGSMAPAYSAASGYAVGDMVLKDGQLYKCNTAIDDEGETWTAAHWTAITAAGQLSQLSEEIDEISEDSKNIFFFTSQTEYSGSDVTVQYVSKDTILVNGTASANVALYALGESNRTGNALKAGTYYVSFEVVSGKVTGPLSFRWGSSQTTWASGVHTSETDASLFIRLSSGTVFENAKIRFWVTVGDQITTYQPYGQKYGLDETARNGVANLKNDVRTLDKGYEYISFFAHRGCTDNAAENTIKAISDAYYAGYKGVEIDARCTIDGIPVLSHETDVTDINGNTYAIASTTWEVLSALTFESDNIQYKIPSLEQALGIAKMLGLAVQLHIKQSSEAAAITVTKAVNASGMLDYVFFNIGHDGYENTRLSGVVKGAEGEAFNISIAYADGVADTYRKYLDVGRVQFGIGKATFDGEIISFDDIKSLEKSGFEFYFVAYTEEEETYLMQYYPTKMEPDFTEFNPKTAVADYVATL